MFTATFTFAPGDYDAEFRALDAQIAALAKSIPGYLGEESWESPASGLISNVYYWDSREALQVLISHPLHIEAKRQQARWLRGYQVLIAEVLCRYGDGGIAHPLSAVAPPGYGLSPPAFPSTRSPP